MKKSLIAAATLAAVTLGAAGGANAGVAGAGLNGIGAHADKSVAEHVDYRKKRYYKQSQAGTSATSTVTARSGSAAIVMATVTAPGAKRL